MKFTNRNVYVSPSATLGRNVRIGDNSTIYDNVRIGDNTTIANDCVIGEPSSAYYDDPDLYSNPPTTIGENSLIRSHAVVYSGTRIGGNFSCGHRVTIREESVIGKNCRIGSLSDLQGHLIVGDYSWMHSNVHIGQQSKIGNFVFIYPYVVLTNDPTPPSRTMFGVTIGDYSQIAVFSVLLPGVTVGRHCLVGAGSVVGKDVEDYQLVLGSPAKPIKRVTEITSRETGEAHYPWPHRFDRGMPWEGTSFQSWVGSQDKYMP